MSAGKICSRIVHTADREESVQAVAMRMKQHGVGSIVVVAEGKPIGIVTDRDLVVRVMAERRWPVATSVGDVMTQHPRTLLEDASLEEGLVVMRRIGVRRIPVVDRDGRLVGLLALDDLLSLLAAELEDVGHVVAQSARGSLPATVPSQSATSRPEGIERAAGEAEC